MNPDPLSLLWLFLAFAAGGVLKGATGAGAPLIAVPLLAMFFGVPAAIAVFAVPNLVANVWQLWSYRHDRPPGGLAIAFAAGSGAGAAIGTVMLARLASEALLLIVALAVFVYVGFRLARPGWRLGAGMAQRLALPVGVAGGVLHGVSGLSAPVTLTFLNAVGLARTAFIVTVSGAFAAMAVVQVPMLWAYGILTAERFWWSVAALVPLFAFMPVGAVLARRLPARVFDRIILAILVALSVRLIVEAT